MDELDIIPNYTEQLLSLPVDAQYKLAERLAANCGYKLVAEDTERSLEIKELKEMVK